MAQYESGTRTPKADLTSTLAHTLDVSPQALDVPDIDSDIGLMHTLFALEDLRGLKICEADGEICLRLDKSRGRTYDDMIKMLTAWREQAAKLEAGEITKEEYDQWRYHYPAFDTTQRWAKVPSQALSDKLVGQFTFITAYITSWATNQTVKSILSTVIAEIDFYHRFICG